MTPNCPQELLEVARELRSHRTRPGALEMDQLKCRVMTQAARSRQRKDTFVRSRLVTMLLVLGRALSGGAAGVIAGGGDSHHSSAARSEYCHNHGHHKGHHNGHHKGHGKKKGHNEC